LAPFEAVRDFKESDVVFVSAVSNTYGITAKFIDSVLLYECSKFVVKSLLLLEICLQRRSNSLHKSISKCLSKLMQVVAVFYSLIYLLTYTSLVLFCSNFEDTSALLKALVTEITVLKFLRVKTLDCAILVALGVDLEV
jgi:hypothetical protein